MLSLNIFLLSLNIDNIKIFLFFLQKFKTIVQLIKEAFFKHGDKDCLRACVKAINYCTTGSRGELQDFAQNKMKELEDELILKVKAAIREVTVLSILSVYFLYYI